MDTLRSLAAKTLLMLDWLNGTGAAGKDLRALSKADLTQMHGILVY